MKNDYTTNGNEQANKIIYKIAELLGTIIMWLSLVSQRMMYICEYPYSKCLDRFRDYKWLGLEVYWQTRNVFSEHDLTFTDLRNFNLIAA